MTAPPAPRHPPAPCSYPSHPSYPLRAAVVGHLEWTTLARVRHLPARGDIVHADVLWEGPAGGGAVAAVRLAALAGACTFFTALGDDQVARRSREVLGRLGVDVVAAVRDRPTRCAVSLVDASAERTTTTLGARLQPEEEDDLPWETLRSCDTVYFTAGGAGALAKARRAAVLTATGREFTTLATAGVPVDAVVGSADDPAERCDPAGLPRPPGLLVVTEGTRGGVFRAPGEPARRYRAVRPPRPVVDCYGAGDNFAAALAFALGTGSGAADAVTFAAADAALCAATRGPYVLPRTPGPTGPHRSANRGAPCAPPSFSGISTTH
ncbi:PfkB family carbohydrate kinase [Streptomyces sp. NPDC048516]|uniref:PfkB family carbohydrate kinase n=1 Tax=Streptomyces sp. NPDC048516 TaxID=3365565 RepID=UPI003718DC84